MLSSLIPLRSVKVDESNCVKNNGMACLGYSFSPFHWTTAARSVQEWGSVVQLHARAVLFVPSVRYWIRIPVQGLLCFLLLFYSVCVLYRPLGLGPSNTRYSFYSIPNTHHYLPYTMPMHPLSLYWILFNTVFYGCCSHGNWWRNSYQSFLVC